MTKRTRATAAVLGATFVLTTAGLGQAQTGSPASPERDQHVTDIGAATELFNAGRDLMKSGDYAAACPKLAESARFDAKVGTLARLAECEEKIGQMVSARAHWQQAINLASTGHDDRLSHVRSELARVDKVVPKLVLTVDGTAPAGLEIHVDDLEIGLGSLGVPLPVEAGNHTVVASAPGKNRWTQSVVAKADGAVIPLHVPVLADAPKPPEGATTLGPTTGAPTTTPSADVPPPSPPSSAEGTSSPLRTVGVITGAVGVVGLAVGGVFALVAKGKLDDSNSGIGACHGNLCSQQGYDARIDARSAGTASTIFVIAGGALVAAGLTMWLVAPRSHASSASARATLHLSPAVAPGAAGFSMGGRW